MSTEIREVPLNDLILDPNLTFRDRLDDFTVERYGDSWDRLPPSTAFEVDGKLLLVDGFHRHCAAESIGKTTMPVEVRQGTYSDALDFAALANVRNGLPLTRAERRRAVDARVRLHLDWADKRLAESLGVDTDSVVMARRKILGGPT